MYEKSNQICRPENRILLSRKLSQKLTKCCWDSHADSAWLVLWLLDLSQQEGDCAGPDKQREKREVFVRGVGSYCKWIEPALAGVEPQSISWEIFVSDKEIFCFLFLLNDCQGLSTYSFMPCHPNLEQGKHELKKWAHINTTPLSQDCWIFCSSSRKVAKISDYTKSVRIWDLKCNCIFHSRLYCHDTKFQNYQLLPHNLKVIKGSLQIMYNGDTV